MTVVTLSPEDLETLGLLVDRMSNFAAVSVLPIPPAIHAEALSSGMQDLHDELKGFLVGKGFNPWQ